MFVLSEDSNVAIASVSSSFRWLSLHVVREYSRTMILSPTLCSSDYVLHKYVLVHAQYVAKPAQPMVSNIQHSIFRQCAGLLRDAPFRDPILRSAETIPASQTLRLTPVFLFRGASHCKNQRGPGNRVRTHIVEQENLLYLFTQIYSMLPGFAATFMSDFWRLTLSIDIKDEHVLVISTTVHDTPISLLRGCFSGS